MPLGAYGVRFLAGRWAPTTVSYRRSGAPA
jgi:hypothetical protein